MLHAKGRNQFRVVRASERDVDLKFPVFLREEGEHSGSLTKLLKNRHELDEALVGAMFRKHQLRTLLVVEYLDTADAGTNSTTRSANSKARSSWVARWFPATWTVRAAGWSRIRISSTRASWRRS